MLVNLPRQGGYAQDNTKRTHRTTESPKAKHRLRDAKRNTNELKSIRCSPQACAATSRRDRTHTFERPAPTPIPLPHGSGEQWERLPRLTLTQLVTRRSLRPRSPFRATATMVPRAVLNPNAYPETARRCHGCVRHKHPNAHLMANSPMGGKTLTQPPPIRSEEPRLIPPKLIKQTLIQPQPIRFPEHWLSRSLSTRHLIQPKPIKPKPN